MNKNKNILLYGLLALCSLLLSGCTHEDNRYCPQGLYIRFVPDNPAHNYPEMVRTVGLYFYGADGSLALFQEYTKEELRAGDRAAFVPQIGEGTYTLIAVINGRDDYRTGEAEKQTTLQTELNGGNPVVKRPADLFSGQRQIVVNAVAEQQEETVRLAKHTNHIRLKVLFQGYDIPEGASLSGRIDGRNGLFHYHSYTSSGYRDYLPHTQYTEDDRSVGFDFTTLRLWHGSDMTLRLEEKTADGGILRTIELDIEQELARVRNDAGVYLYDTDAKLEYYDNYELTLVLGPDFMVIALQVNNWYILGGGVEI